MKWGKPGAVELRAGSIRTAARCAKRVTAGDRPSPCPPILETLYQNRETMATRKLRQDPTRRCESAADRMGAAGMQPRGSRAAVAAVLPHRSGQRTYRSPWARGVARPPILRGASEPILSKASRAPRGADHLRAPAQMVKRSVDNLADSKPPPTGGGDRRKEPGHFRLPDGGHTSPPRRQPSARRSAQDSPPTPTPKP